MPRVTEEHRRRQRARILAAAEACFARNGFHATAMDQIIDEAGMSSSTVYRYFPGKRQIIHEVSRTRMDPVIEALRQACEQEDPPSPHTVLDAVVTMLAPWRTVRDQPPDDRRAASETFALVAVNVWAEAARDEDLAAMMRGVFEEEQRLAVRLVRRWQDRGDITDAVGADALALLLRQVVLGQAAEIAVTSDGSAAGSMTALSALLDALRPPSR